jgi:hypothetical protein
MWNVPVDTVQIEVPRWLFRAMQWRPLNLFVAALTGVSVSFCPLSLYELGTARVPFLGWRVLSNFAVILLVSFVYVSFGAPVLGRAGRRSTNDSASAPDDARRRPSARGDLFFWLLFLVTGVVIWVVSFRVFQ